MRNAKRTYTELLSKQLNERTERKIGEGPTPGAAQTPTQVIPAVVGHDKSTSSPSMPKAVPSHNGQGPRWSGH